MLSSRIARRSLKILAMASIKLLEVFMKNGFEYLSYVKPGSTDEEFCKKSLKFTNGIVDKFATSLGHIVDRSPLLEEHRAHCKEVLNAKVDFGMVADGSIGVLDTKTGDKDQCHDIENYFTRPEWATIADENCSMPVCIGIVAFRAVGLKLFHADETTYKHMASVIHAVNPFAKLRLDQVLDTSEQLKEIVRKNSPKAATMRCSNIATVVYPLRPALMEDRELHDAVYAIDQAVDYPFDVKKLQQLRLQLPCRASKAGFARQPSNRSVPHRMLTVAPTIQAIGDRPFTELTTANGSRMICYTDIAPRRPNADDKFAAKLSSGLSSAHKDDRMFPSPHMSSIQSSPCASPSHEAEATPPRVASVGVDTAVVEMQTADAELPTSAPKGKKSMAAFLHGLNSYAGNVSSIRKEEREEEKMKRPAAAKSATTKKTAETNKKRAN